MASAVSTPTKRLLPKLRPSTRLVLTVAVIVAALYFGWNYFSSVWILSQHYPDIKPGTVSLIGIKGNGEFKIVVANRMAQLVEAKDGRLGTEDGGATDDGGETQGAIKKRIPITEMLGALKGSETDLSQFVSKLNDLAPDESWPTTRNVWKSEDIRKALDGDAALQSKLIHALNVDLDGNGLPDLSQAAIQDGIVVETPVQVHVRVGAENRIMTAKVQRPFLPNLMKATFNEYKEKADVTRGMIMGYYLQHKDKDGKQNIRKALEDLINPALLSDEVHRAEDVLSKAVVVVNEAYIDKASYEAAPLGGQKLYNMILHVTEEGRQRLWQYSKLHPNDQILLVSDGVAIAAPRIRHDLWTSDFEISQMPDEILVQDAVNSINAAHKK